MMTNKQLILFLAWILVGLSVPAQETLTLREAIETALDDNITIRMARNTTDIARQQNTTGNAGHLPTVTLSGNGNYGISNNTFELLSQPEPVRITGAENLGYSASVNLNYTIYGGMGAFITKKKLNLSEQNAEVQERLNIETIILRTIQAYCQALQSQNNLNIAEQSMAISRSRLERTKVRYELASENKLTYLNAKVDYQNDSINLINARNSMETSRLQLAQLMFRKDAQFALDTNLNIQPVMALEDLMQAAKENNSALLNASYNRQLSETELNLVNASRHPRLSLQSSYNFNHTENNGGFMVFNETSGFSGMLQLSIPIFDGMKKNVQAQTARIQLENAELNRMEEESKLERDLKTAYANYQRALQVSQLDDVTVETAQLNFERSQDLYESGQINGTQFREAQLNLLRSQLQAANNDINVKLAEVELMRLSGQLLQ